MPEKFLIVAASRGQLVGRRMLQLISDYDPISPYGGDLASTGIQNRRTRAEVHLLVNPVENSQLRILTTLSLLNNQ